MQEQVEKLEYTLILLDDALKRYDKAASLVQEAFESVVNIVPPSDGFRGQAALQHKLTAIRLMALILESMQKDDLRKRVAASDAEVHHLLTFLRLPDRPV